MTSSELVLVAVAVYLGLGLLIGPAWLLLRMPGLDPALQASGRSVRLLLIPGAVAVWPALLLTLGGRDAP